MSGRWSSIQTYDPQEAAYPQEAADGGSFAPLASARYLQVTTFGRDGRPVPARMRGVVDGGRAYFGARSWSGTVRRLRHADAVQVAPCGVLGLCYGPPLDAAARLLPAEEAMRAAAELARKYPVRRRSLSSWLRRAWRPTMVHYELVADDATDDQDTYPEASQLPVSEVTNPGSYAVRGSQGPAQCQVLRTHVTDHGAGSIACVWPAHVRPSQP
jgi:PPOX class probable F420-dependent enzyme